MRITTDAWLMDTNVLLRWAFVDHHDYPLVASAVSTLRERGALLCATPQNLVEFWNSATRPAARNGFSLTPAQANENLGRVEDFFFLLQDNAAVYGVWRQTVVAHGVSGTKVHDARLAAFMRVYGVPSILTFNTDDFRRFDFLAAVSPRDVA